MRRPRQYLNATVLPDGKVLATGGGAHRTDASQAVLAAEMWDPATRAWSEMASMQVGRLYHSTALLLPDARVLSAGGGRATALSYDRANAEIYSPPYLFRGPRPEIGVAPSNLRYGAGFRVGGRFPVHRGFRGGGGENGAHAVLMAPGVTTHGTDMQARYVELAIVRRDRSGLNAVAPPTPNVAPPGWYMLFLLSRQGVPSVARWVHLGRSGGL
jgi:hypothetical protein